MNRLHLLEIINNGNIQWRKHALERMLQRSISRSEVKEAIKYGEIIENYEDDTPFPSALFFYSKVQNIHVVASLDHETKTLYIITAYIPNNIYFEDNLKTRRKYENR